MSSARIEDLEDLDDLEDLNEFLAKLPGSKPTHMYINMHLISPHTFTYTYCKLTVPQHVS